MVATTHLISAAFFCPRARRPNVNYVTELRSFLNRNKYGASLLAHVSRLDQAWQLFADARPDIQALPHGVRDLNLLVSYAGGGPVSEVCETSSGVIALPLLLVLQLGQYFRYLEIRDLSHEGFLRQVQPAGIHGFCGGAAAALCIACAKDEYEVIQNAAVLLRITMGLGAAMDAAGDPTSSAPTTVVMRLKYEGQGEDLLNTFPGAFISAVTEPKSISIVGPAETVAALACHAKELGLPVHITDITGKTHNPENADLAEDMLALLRRHTELQLPRHTILRSTYRSNRDGEQLKYGSVMVDLVTMILASKCEWYTLLSRVAEDLSESDRSHHTLAVFGMDDCVSLSPFNKLELKVSRFEARSLSFSGTAETATGTSKIDFPPFPDTAIAIVGASCRLPGANDLDELWKLVFEGRDCHQKAPKSRFDSSESFRVSQSGSPMWMDNLYGNFIDVMSFDNSFFGVNPKEAANMDPQQRLLLELSFEALDSSGYLATHVRERGDAVGCFIGASMVEYLDNTNAHPPTAYTSTGTLRAFLCGRLSYYYGWTGPSEVIDTACSSSLVAIHRACTALVMGECTAALAGGVNAITGINNLLDLGKAGFLSPTGQCKAFDVSADGYCRAEGAGLVVLKLLKNAVSDNDDILGVIPGVATNQGGLSPTLTVPSTQALQALYKNVLLKAGMSPSDISYVEAHATGTQAGDPVEMDSIRSVFGDPSRAQPLRIGSIKGNTGHCETAAGVAGLLKVLAMIRNGAIPPQANYHTLNPKIPPLEIDNLEIPRSITAWPASLRAALVNSYGAAGSNCALLCCEIPANHTNPRPAATYQSRAAIPLFLSAASESSLLSYAQVVAKYLSRKASDMLLSEVAYTINHRRNKNKYCLAVTTTELSKVVESFKSANTPSFEVPSNPKPVCLVFGGQNDDQFSISHTFMDAYPAFRAHVDSCDVELVKLGYDSLYPTIFDGPPHSSAVSQQCRLFVVQYASARCWIDAGLKISAIIGHSLGEFAALVVAGALSLADGIKLVATRAHLMDTMWGEDRGAMLAIFTGVSEVERLINRVNSASSGPRLKIACYNAPRAIVVAGASTQIESAKQVLTSDSDFRNIRFQQLSTTHAFHSELVEPILAAIDKLAATLNFNEPLLSLEICTANPMNSIVQWSPSKHAREPVYFSDAIRRVEQRLGSCFWLEAGLNTCAISLARKASLVDASHTFQALDIKSRKDPYNVIAETVSSLWRYGSPVKHWAFLAMRPKQVWLPPYQFEKRSHGIQNIDRAMEAHKKLAERSSVASKNVNPKARQLVSLLETSTSTFTFLVDGQCERFQQIVTGHAVVACPLCPASMYMECVVMAIQLLVAETQNSDLMFEDLDFSAPLGVGTDCTITIQITRTVSKTAWEFKVQSTLPGTPTRSSVHCSGRLATPHSNSLVSYARLLGDPLQRLLRSETAERLKSTRIYGLFSKVVHYEPFLRSISSIVLEENEAVATVQLPEDQPGREESAAWQRCDAPLLDAFISVAGFLINGSESVSSEQVMVAVAVERINITTSCSATSPGPWKVYARFTSDDTHAISDVFVYDSQQKAVAMFGGVRFTRVQLARLKKTLSILGGNSTQPLSELVPSISTTSSISIDTACDTPDTDMESIRQPSQVHIGSASQGDHESSVRKIVSEYTGMKESAIPLNCVLVDLGVDSLSSLELATDIATKLGLIIDSFELGQLTVADILKRLNVPSSVAPVTVKLVSPEAADSVISPTMSIGASVTAAFETPQPVAASIVFRKPFDVMAKAEEQFEAFASNRGFKDYWNRVAPFQNELLVAYIIEAFRAMGSDLGSLPLGAQVPPIVSQPRHTRMLQRLWGVLQTHEYVEIKDEIVTRKSAKVCAKRSSELHKEFIARFPEYTPEARLMQLAGEKLAECISGKQDPVALLFGNRDSSKIMEDYYHNSPMLSSATDLLVAYIVTLTRDIGSTLRILEVGAGTGGTTSSLVKALSGANVACEYTFTDISPVLVAKAKSKFAKYPWMSFTTLDLEAEMRHDFRSGFNIIIATNCTHATKSRVTSCRRLKDGLAEHGILILSEVTRTIDWYDMCFGLLDGWWLAGNGTEYPLQTASVWMDALSEACFASFGFSKGSTEEATTQQLLVGVTRGLNTNQSTTSSNVDYRIETMEYKKIDGVSILADIYVPHNSTTPMPIAIMTHGGGHMTLSRKYIRPAQTRHLLAHGFLPVSLDFRLCPEVNLIDGPMADVCDGYRWAKEIMPQELMKQGVVVDSEKIVAVGWSTGGHLALSLAWTTLQAGLLPPTAILSFYAPVNFDSADIYRDCGTTLARPSKNVLDIIKTIPRQPITTYTPTKDDPNNHFWLQPGDVRSDLLISVFKDGMGLPLFVNGLPQDTNCTEIPMPSEERIAKIDPLVQLRHDQYKTPTCVVHPTKDNIAPYAAARRFVKEMEARGLRHKFLSPEGVGHAFDVNLQKGEMEWERYVAPGYQFLFDSV